MAVKDCEQTWSGNAYRRLYPAYRTSVQIAANDRSPPLVPRCTCRSIGQLWFFTAVCCDWCQCLHLLQAFRFKKIHAVIPPPNLPQWEAGRGYVGGSQQHVLRRPDLINDLPLLGVTDASRVEPVGEFVLGAG